MPFFMVALQEMRGAGYSEGGRPGKGGGRRAKAGEAAMKRKNRGHLEKRRSTPCPAGSSGKKDPPQRAQSAQRRIAARCGRRRLATPFVIPVRSVVDLCGTHNTHGR